MKEVTLVNWQMSSGKIASAIGILTDKQTKGVLPLNEKIGNKTVEQILREKHPDPVPIDPNYLIVEPDRETPFHPSIFDHICVKHVRQTAMKLKGSYGPSGLDAHEWRRLLTAFGQASTEQCKIIAKVARRIGTEKIPDDHLEEYNACRLIPLDKNPGVRPIGIGEVVRRLIGKILIRCVQYDLLELGQNRQLCLGQKCGIEYAIHTLRNAFNNTEKEAILLIDAENAFNSLNRELALKNVKLLCPSISNALKNSYSIPPSLFVNGKKLQSKEGTTQGDPLAMAMYGIAIIPLIERLENDEICQKWYADDGSAVGNLDDLKVTLEKVIEHGKAFGYYVKSSKCKLIVKDGLKEKAAKVFEGKDIKIVDGFRVLGSVIGTNESCEKFMSQKFEEYEKICLKLSNLVKTSPQNVYSCFTKGVQEKLSFLYRTTPDTKKHRAKMKTVIEKHLIPSITGRAEISNQDLRTFSLPLRNGGMNINNPDDHDKDYDWSIWVSESLKSDDIHDASLEQSRRNLSIRGLKRAELKSKRDEITENCSVDEKRAIDLASEKGASNWLNVLPLKK